MTPTDETPPILSRWDLLPFAGLTAAWLWFQHWLPLLPQRVPAHWNAEGQINGWMDKDGLFFFVIIFTVGIWVLLFLIGLILRGNEDRQARALGLLPLRAWLALGFALMLGYAMPMAAMQGQQAFFVGIGLFLACLVTGIVFFVRANQ